METLFYISAAVAVISSALTVVSRRAVHALIYLAVSFGAVSLIFYTLGDTLLAILEIIIYAGAIMVLFLFAVMMLNRGGLAEEIERQSLQPRTLVIPAGLVLVLLIAFSWLVYQGGQIGTGAGPSGPRELSLALFGPYLLGIELASVLLLSGLIGAFHIGRRVMKEK